VSSVALKILLVVEDGVDSAPIEDALPAGARVTKTTLNGGGQAWPGLRAAAAEAELLILGCSHQEAEALDLVETASRHSQDGLPVVVLYQGSPNGFMQQAFAAGADDLITLPQPPVDLAFALEKAIARRRGGIQAQREGALITVLGPKGGTGKTLTACNLGVALASHAPAPVIVDLDLQFGDVGLALGLRPEHTIYDLATSGGSLDADKIDGFLAEHESGVRALLAPVRPDQAAAVTTQFLRVVLDQLRSRHEFIIVDTPPAFSPEVIAAIDASTHLCVVGMLDALSLKDTKIGLETLAQMGHDPENVTLVLNRADSSVGITQSDVERLLGRKPDVLVPSDRAIPRAVTEGRTIIEAAPRSGAARAYVALAEKLATAALAAAEPSEPEAKPRRSLLGMRGR
jgi:pilus assembly protein CpaE